MVAKSPEKNEKRRQLTRHISNSPGRTTNQIRQHFNWGYNQTNDLCYKLKAERKIFAIKDGRFNKYYPPRMADQLGIGKIVNSIPNWRITPECFVTEARYY